MTLSIKLKVTLWYTFLMVLVVTAILFFMWAISGTVIETDLKKEVVTAVNTVASSIDEDDDEIQVNTSLIQNGVYVKVYKENKSSLLGSFPGNFDETGVTFQDAVSQTIIIGETEFYVYDDLVTISTEEGTRKFWIRGVIQSDQVPNLSKSLFSIALFALPVLVILAALGGYLISRRAFKPMDNLMATAETISEGKDLSRRINLGTHDEIGRLAQTFDGMLSRLERAFENEKQFASDASHELRTPITVILAQTELAQAKAKTLKDHQEALTVIHDQATKTAALISSLLALTRLDQPDRQPDFTLIDLSGMAEAVCEEQKDHWDKPMTLETSIERNVTVVADQTLMMRLMTNLIENAYQYGRPEGHILVTLKTTKNETVFSVTDDGIGISKSDQEKIFNRFYQVDHARNASQRGCLGLGLALVKTIADLHHGTITVDSVLGQGSTFTFTMPKKVSSF